MRARTLPRDDDRCGWFRTDGGDRPGAGPEPDRTPFPPLAGAQRADAVVVGAGLTGLAAARRLAEVSARSSAPTSAEPRIVVLEAQRAGYGASGRSSGFVVDIAYFTTVMDPPTAERHIRLSRRGIDTLRRLVAEHGIECAWDETGWIHAAAGDGGLRDLATLADWLDARGEAYEDLDPDGMERVTGTPFYRRGLRLPGRPLLQPAALLRGLTAALPGGVELHERSPVRAIGRAGGAWRVETGAGSVTAPRVLLAVNGYSPALGALRRRIFPLITFGSFTRPLTAEERRALGGDPEWGLLAQDPLGSSLRRTRDHRLLVRNTLHYSRDLEVGPAIRERAREAHRRALARRWPELFGGDGGGEVGGIGLEDTWAGVMGASPSRRHLFERLDDGLYAAAGFTGAGIAMGTVAGELLAEWSAGVDSEWLRDMRSLPGPGRTPPEPFLSLGIRWKVARMNAAAQEYL
ncbi:MAG: FAD-binding oxidoreductase [Acidobacteriota bacterium]|jgi:glycine/D-amino acid oxidase-like deaminating enzyme